MRASRWPEQEKVTVRLQKYLSNAVTQVDEKREGGRNILQMVVSGGNGRESVLLDDGETLNSGENRRVQYKGADSAVRITETESGLIISSPSKIVQTMMQGDNPDTAGSAARFRYGAGVLHRQTVQYRERTRTAGKKVRKSDPGTDPGRTGRRGCPHAVFDVTVNGKTSELCVVGGPSIPAAFGYRHRRRPGGGGLRQQGGQTCLSPYSSTTSSSTAMPAP